jgi:hypothetical protein
MGLARAKRGAPEPGTAQLRQGMATLQALGSEEGCSLMLAQLAEGYLAMGRAEQGQSLEEDGERFRERQLYHPMHLACLLHAHCSNDDGHRLHRYLRDARFQLPLEARPRHERTL